MSRFGRREFLKGTLAAGVAATLPVAVSAADGGASGAEPERVTFAIPGLDPAHDGLRVAQLSDIHVGPRTPARLVRDAVARANAFQPDLVVLTGDFLSFRSREVEALRAQLGGIAAPTVAVLGNHDHWVDAEGARDALRGHGYEVLDNAWTTVRLRGAPLHVVGVGDLLTGHADVGRATSGLPPRAAPLVLAHGPRTADRLRTLDRHLVCLSGHTHGGQIDLPILTPAFVRVFMHEPYLRGGYAVGKVQLYVNRGVGMSGLRMRVNCPPEVTLATLRAAEAA